jgi:hypothetical protein
MSSGSPIEKGTPIRYPSVALLCVDSADTEKFNSAGFRIDDNSPSRIYINKQRPLLFGYMTRLALTEMDIQWDIPNVNSRNNTLKVRLFAYTDATPPVVTSTVSTYTFTPGYYTHLELATALQTKLTADAFTIANGLTFVVDVTAAGAFEITQTAQYAPSNRFKGAFQFLRSGNQYDLLDPMGISPVDKRFTTFTSGLAPMSYTPYVDVVSNLLTKNQNVQDGVTNDNYTSSKLARIYFSNEQIEDITPEVTSNKDTNFIGTSPFFCRREFKFPKQIQWNNTENVDVIDIQVLDYKGNPVFIEPVTVIDENSQDALNEEIGYQESTVFRFTIQATEV